MNRMFAGAPLSWWLGFHALVLLLLLVDLFLLKRTHASWRVRVAWSWTAFLAALACGFALFLTSAQGHRRGLEFFSGYLVEGSLSVDNLFVFLLMFRSLRLGPHQQERVLLLGVVGAIVMRGLFIGLGVELLTRFAVVEYVFAVMLLVAAFRLMRQNPQKEGVPTAVRWLEKRGLRGEDGLLTTTGFLLVVAAVEATDLLFALDSIPAVLAISRDPFVVYTSNIFAILGLRSLYFALAAVLNKLRLLHYGLAVILAFVGIKMLIARWIQVPVAASLGFIVLTLAGFAIASRRLDRATGAAE